jgi:hypothetical protein
MSGHTIACAVGVPVATVVFLWYLLIPKEDRQHVWCSLSHFGHKWYIWPSGWGRTCDRCGYQDVYK